MIQAGRVMKTRMQLYWQLVRMDKPLWIAAEGKPSVSLVLLFTLGTVLMRSAGCAINDFADRDIDRYVKRTAMRPLTSGRIKAAEAIWVAVVLSAISFLLVLFLNNLTIGLSFVALFVAATYPWFKRFFALPQAYLGIAFGFGIPMAFAAVQNTLPLNAWLLLLGNVFWSLAYDTEYAMVDRDDDLKIGIRTSAITFGRFDVAAVMGCYAAMLSIQLYVGLRENLGGWFLAGWVCALCCVWHLSACAYAVPCTPLDSLRPRADGQRL